LRLVLGQASGWATLGLAVAAIALAYLFRDRLPAWHYTAGYTVAALTVLHGWLSISPQSHSTAFTVGVWIATGAMLLVLAQVAIGLRLPFGVAEELKVTYGHCDPSTIDEDDMIDLSHFMQDCNDLVPRKLLAEIIQARVEELFEMVHEEIRKSGYDGLLPAGVVVTGGTAELPGILDIAGQILDLPARLGTPLGLHGLADTISRPAYATPVGLLLWGLRHTSLMLDDEDIEEERPGRGKVSRLGRWLRAFLP